MTFLLAASIVAAVIVMAVAVYLGFKYPAGWSDWPHDRIATVRYALSGILFLLILGLIYWVTRYWDYPIGGKALAYIAFGTIFVLFILGLMNPIGRRT